MNSKLPLKYLALKRRAVSLVAYSQKASRCLLLRIGELVPSRYVAGEIAVNMFSRMTSSLALKIAPLVAAALMFTAPSQAQMACQINLEFTKGGFVIGGSGGGGTLTCNGQNYPVKIGGLSAGLVIGISRVNLVGEVRNLYEISDIEGTYSGVGASMAIGGGADNLVAANAKGVQLVLRGTQVGLDASLDLSGLNISLR